MSGNRASNALTIALILFISASGPLMALSPRRVGIIRSKLDSVNKDCTDPKQMRQALGVFIQDLVASGLTADEAGRTAFLAARKQLETTAKALKKPGGMRSFFVLKVRLLGDAIVEGVATEGGVQALEGLPGALGLEMQASAAPATAPLPPSQAVAGESGADRAARLAAHFKKVKDVPPPSSANVPPPPTMGTRPDESASVEGYDSFEDDQASPVSGEDADTAPPPPGMEVPPSSGEYLNPSYSDEPPPPPREEEEASTGSFEVAYEEDPVRQGSQEALAAAGSLDGTSSLVVLSPGSTSSRFDVLDGDTESMIRKGLETGRSLSLPGGIYHVVLHFEGSSLYRFNLVLHPGEERRLTWPATGTLRIARPSSGGSGVQATVRDAFSSRIVREGILPNQRIRLPEGNWKLEFTDVQGQLRSGDLPIRAGKVATIRP